MSRYQPPQPDSRWQEHAACRTVDPEIFWPPANTPLVLERYLAQAKPVCNRCPVRQACLLYAIEHGEYQDGIWGGTTPKERHQLVVAQLTREATA
ncbi:MAG TPA: WhiB family transcriptional regulator [Sporichthya sp.]|nr:WhiB family transcriptional regulator [Sporichthya sp.]